MCITKMHETRFKSTGMKNKEASDVFFFNKFNLGKLLIGLVSAIFLSEAISYLTLHWLSLSNTPWPWSFIDVLSHGFYLEVVVSIALLFIPLLSLKGVLSGGMARFVTGLGISFVIGLLATFWLGLILLQWMDHYEPISPWQILGFLQALSMNNSGLLHFIVSELVAAIIIGFIPCYLFFERIRPANNVLGRAQFTNGFEIHRVGFFKKEQESIIIAKKYGAPIYANGFEHVLVFAPSGSGKTRSIAMPNLFNYPYSIVCNDVKFTLFETTSGYRKNILGHECFCFAPARHTSITHRYNPLAFISNDKNQRITDIQRIAHIFIPDLAKEPFWPQTSRKLFKALVLFLLDTPERPTTFGEINRLIKQHDFDGWLQSTLDNTERYDAEFYRNGYSYINNDDRTRANILESFSGHFELFDDPVIDAATSGQDFDFSDLRRKKMTIYVGFTDEDMERLAPLLTLFWQQLISSMIQKIPDPIDERLCFLAYKMNGSRV